MPMCLSIVTVDSWLCFEFCEVILFIWLAVHLVTALFLIVIQKQQIILINIDVSFQCD